MPGVSTATAQTVIAEIGLDMSVFPSPGHLCAWAGLAPANHESAGKRRPAGTRRGSRWLRRTMIEAAWAATRTKNSYYRALFARIARRRGRNKAIVAVAHSMLATIWHLQSTGSYYQDLGSDYFHQHHEPATEAKRLQRRIEALGYTVTITQPAA